MFFEILPYLAIVVVLGAAAVLLTSKKLAQKFVAAGMLPHAFLGVLPALQSAIRAFGCVLVVAGMLKISMDSGWIDSRMLSRYGFPGCLILLGLMMLFLSRRGG